MKENLSVLKEYFMILIDGMDFDTILTHYYYGTPSKV